MSEYQRWETRFATPGYLFGTEPNSFLKSKAHLLKAGQTALSIADGEGRNGVFLAERGLDVLAMDFSPTALNKARALAAERGVALRIEQADLVTWAWPAGAFDVVVAIFIQFLTPAQRSAVFAGMKRTLRPGGLLLMQGYRPKQLEYKTGGPPEVENLYTRALLEEAFADFSSLEIEEHDSVIREGSGHGGMSALIDLVGRK
jgi:cyclopropane fatty-acyl-phospholipid synthase-like methyltransferase